MKIFKFVSLIAFLFLVTCVALGEYSITPPATFESKPINRGGESYRLIVFGDVHYDGEEYHHFLEEKWKKIIKAIPRNIEMWETRMWKMLDAALLQKNADTALIIQIGDLVEGNCGNGDVQVKMIQDGIQLMRDKFKGTPFIFSAGNHDYNGRDAQVAFDRAALPYYSEFLGKKQSGRTFAFVLKNDLYIFTDYNNPDLEVIEKALRENSSARYKFLVTHGSVLPSDLPVLHGYFLSNDRQKYEYMRNLFLQNEVIVLSGHSHVVELIDCVAKEGRLTQVTLDSRWTPAEVVNKNFSSTMASQYGRRQKTPETQAIYNEYKGAIKEFMQIHSAAYAVIDVTADGVYLKMYLGDKKEAFYTYKVR
jgi:hypothetical protein